MQVIRFWRVCSNPSPATLEDFIFCWLLLGPFSEFPVAGGLRPSAPKDSSMTGVDECLNLLQCRSCGFPCFCSIQLDKFCYGVEDILILMLMVRLGDAQTFYIRRKVALVLSVLTFTSPSVTPPPPPPLFVNSAALVDETGHVFLSIFPQS